MTADNFGDNADKTTNPQNAGGGAQADARVPVFVGDSTEFLRHVYSVQAPVYKRWIKYGGIFFGLALMYALVFITAESLFPQFYRSWLDFCMPLAEYIGGLTPRAGRITGELIAGGYPERADDALHGIAIARVLLFPVFICILMVATVSSVVSRPVVSCTRRTRRRVWMRLCLGLFAGCALAIYFVYAVEFHSHESFDISSYEWKGRLDDYHRGNFAMVADIMTASLTLCIFALVALGLSMLCAVRFITTQRLGDKS